MNGWTNYETHSFYSWLMNNEDEYRLTMELVKTSSNLADDLKRIFFDGIPKDLHPFYRDCLVTWGKEINYDEIAAALLND